MCVMCHLGYILSRQSITLVLTTKLTTIKNLRRSTHKVYCVLIVVSLSLSLTRKSNSTHDASASACTLQWRFQHMLFHRDLELWSLDPRLMTMMFISHLHSPFHLCPIVHHWWKFGENLVKILFKTVLISPETAVSSILCCLFHRNLDLWVP